MMPRIWTDPVIDDVLSRIRAGERTADIAKEYGISTASLRSAIYQHRGSVVSEARNDMYADMGRLWEAGWTSSDIARKYGVDPRTVTRIIARHRDLFPGSRRRVR